MLRLYLELGCVSSWHPAEQVVVRMVLVHAPVFPRAHDRLWWTPQRLQRTITGWSVQ